MFFKTRRIMHLCFFKDIFFEIENRYANKIKENKCPKLGLKKKKKKNNFRFSELTPIWPWVGPIVIWVMGPWVKGSPVIPVTSDAPFLSTGKSNCLQHVFPRLLLPSLLLSVKRCFNSSQSSLVKYG